jgi:hypothetical protein
MTTRTFTLPPAPLLVMSHDESRHCKALTTPRCYCIRNLAYSINLKEPLLRVVVNLPGRRADFGKPLLSMSKPSFEVHEPPNRGPAGNP